MRAARARWGTVEPAVVPRPVRRWQPAVTPPPFPEMSDDRAWSSFLFSPSARRRCRRPRPERKRSCVFDEDAISRDDRRGPGWRIRDVVSLQLLTLMLLLFLLRLRFADSLGE